MGFRLPRDCKHLLHIPESMLASWLSHTAPYAKASPPMGFPLLSYSWLLITLLFWFFCSLFCLPLLILFLWPLLVLPLGLFWSSLLVLFLSSSLISPHSLFPIMVRCRFRAIFNLQLSLSALNSSWCPLPHSFSCPQQKLCLPIPWSSHVVNLYIRYMYMYHNLQFIQFQSSFIVYTP